VRGVWIALALAAMALSIWGDLVARAGEYGKDWWYPVPGFFALLGFVGTVVIVVMSKWLGHYWLQRRPDYYEDGDDE